ncbi:MAG: hypothetical protein HY033_12530 [Ignavibacteriae bacterium]|nr:hypothetical protein [Ignavibacteria bacterium]MBI3365719.1 hypothetical protein [Ignavibacteriota bacterium]
MSSEKESHEKLAADLLKNFHDQFAENKKMGEQFFLKIVSFLGAIVVGYSYIYNNFSGDVIAFSFVSTASVMLLLFGSAIVTVLAYSFKRDEYVNARIRKYARIIGDDKPFPSDYDSSHAFRKRIDRLFWMPDIFFIFFLVFPLFQWIILLSYSMKRQLQFACCQQNTFDTWTVIISLASLLASFMILLSFGGKLKRRINAWEKEFKQHNEHAGT